MAYYRHILAQIKLQYVSPLWNDVMASDADKLERVQRKFAAFYFTGCFYIIPYNYACALELPQLHVLQVRSIHFHPHFHSCSFRI